MLDPGQRLTDAGDLAPCLPAAAEHAESGSVFAGEILGRDSAGGAGAELAQLVCLDHGGATALEHRSEKLSAVGVVLDHEEKETGEVRHRQRVDASLRAAD